MRRHKTIQATAVPVNELHLILQQEVMTGSVTLKRFFEQMNRYLIGKRYEDGYR